MTTKTKKNKKKMAWNKSLATWIDWTVVGVSVLLGLIAFVAMILYYAQSDEKKSSNSALAISCVSIAFVLLFAYFVYRIGISTQECDLESINFKKLSGDKKQLLKKIAGKVSDQQEVELSKWAEDLIKTNG